MAMDGLALSAMLSELQCLVGGKIDKAQQPDKDQILLTIRSDHKNYRLLLCSHAENGRVQLTEKTFPNPAEPPMFCMLLRRRLTGGRIVSVTQRDLDRVLTFTISSRSELGDEISLRLVCELMGKHSNISLIGHDGLVMDCIRHVSPQMSSVRTMLPGCVFFDAPSQDKTNPLIADESDWSALLSESSTWKTVNERMQGLSRDTIMASDLLSKTPREICSFFQRLSCGAYEPTLVLNEFSEPLSVFPFVPASMGASFLPCESLSAAYDRFYERRDAAVRVSRQSQQLKKVLSGHLSRAEKKLQLYNEAIEGSDSLEQLRLYGELITANMYRISRGQRVLSCENYYADPPEKCAVPLDPLLPPADNAQRYYRLYRKKKSAREYALKQVEQLLEEISYLEGQLLNIEHCENLPELYEIREELIRENYIHPERKGVRQKQPPSRPMRFVAEDGVEILVGKNNRQNDALTSSADGDHIWMHVKNMPGPHVIIRCAKPSEHTLYSAAQLAAYYSSGRTGASVPVDYTPRRYVKKPSGSKAGMVVYTTNRTLYITPEESFIKMLKREDNP